jgi:hypothetical protein
MSEIDLNNDLNKETKLTLEDQYKSGFISDKVLMVKPTLFATNYQTLEDNKFMVEIKENVQDRALQEFNYFVTNLVTKGVKVQVETQCHEAASDSIFPNNWFSTHKNEYFPDGLLIIYPLKAENRRLERNSILIENMKKNYKNFIDLSYLELEGDFLESTGCLIFDNINRTVYCSISERASKRALDIFIEMFNKFSLKPYKLVAFKASDMNGNAIYHTNVLMSVLEKHIIICLETIKDEIEKENLIKEINSSGKSLVDVTFEELKNFGCNVLSVKNTENKTVLILSKAAYEGFSEKNRTMLESEYVLAVNDIATIELVGGGSARCMVAEIYDSYYGNY